MPDYPLPKSHIFERVDRTIHPKCEMHAFALGRHDEQSARNYYFFSTDYLLARMLAAFDFLEVDPGQSSLLDFACGYGRNARFFQHCFREVVVSDLEPEMLDFNSEHFGVKGILSSMDPDQVFERHARRYDVVFCFSLFTHLSLEHWTRWLRALFDLVDDGGTLVFTTRSSELAQTMANADIGARLIGETRTALRMDPGGREGTLDISGLRLETSRPFSGTLHLSTEFPGNAVPELGEASCPSDLCIAAPRVDFCPGVGRHAIRIRVPVATSAPVSSAELGSVSLRVRFASAGVTAIDPTAAPPALFALPESDFDFAQVNETRGRIDENAYGSATVTDDFVRDAIARELPNGKLTCWLPMGLGDLYQDVYFVRKLAPA